MLKEGARLEERDLGRDPLSVDELRAIFGDRDPRNFLNPRNALYREKRMNERPPSAEEALRLMAREPNLIKRPLVVRGRSLVAGYDEEALRRLLID